ncbi:AAA family ATPase, partial [Candidatus Dojkabacteria bacterium]|nr:AAA family ATPase [Candidatus Dojkabacteria bacterium]
MALTGHQQKTIELLNPWHTGKEVNLGILRAGYLTKISDIVNTRKQILFILGSRRVGKTVTLFQYIYQLINQGVSPKTILFLSLDNTTLEGLDLFTYLTESKYKYIFLDEVHYFPKWAQILKSLYDLPNNRSKIICSGSSSKLIEDNKAFLTGRSISITVYPLSFIEFKGFNKNSDKLHDYLYYGGYPEYVLEKQPNYLNELL